MAPEHVENLKQFKTFEDDRGALVPIPLDELDLSPRRVFIVTGADGGCTRGGHGHRSGTQWLVLVSGQVNVLVRSDGEPPRLTRLSTRGEALKIRQGDIAWQRYADAGSCLLVLSDAEFDPDGYINPIEALSDSEVAMLSGS